jgi:YVTN family beta-propeller protein
MRRRVVCAAAASLAVTVACAAVQPAVSSWHHPAHGTRGWAHQSSFATLTSSGGMSAVSVGGDPDGVAVDAATGMVYVDNSGSDTVSVIDAATRAVTATIPVGSEPEGIAVDAATDTIYVANHGATTVSVIDGATSTVTATLTVGTTPDAVAVDPVTDMVYVTTYGYVDQIDGATNAVTPDWVYVTGTGVSDSMAIDPGSGDLYLVNFWTNDQVLVIDTATGTQTGYIQGGAGADAVAVDPVSNQLYVANCEPSFGNGVWIFDLTSGNIQAEVSDPCPTDIAADAGNATGIAVDQGTGTISFISAARGVLGHVTDSAIPVPPPGPAPDPTGNIAADSVTGTVYIADQNTPGTVTVITPAAPRFTSKPAATFRTGRRHTFTITTTGYPAPRITKHGKLPKGLRLKTHPDGTATITGTPSRSDKPGSYRLKLTATNATSKSATQTFRLRLK